MLRKILYLIFISFSFNTVSNAQSLWFKNIKQNEITVISNPVFNELKIEYEGTDFAEYFIFDMDEKLIRQGWFMKSIPLQYIPPGSYFLIVRTKDEIIKRQFLKLKPENNMSMFNQKTD